MFATPIEPFFDNIEQFECCLSGQRRTREMPSATPRVCICWAARWPRPLSFASKPRLAPLPLGFEPVSAETKSSGANIRRSPSESRSWWQLENRRFVTPTVTPGAFSVAPGLAQIRPKPLILNVERVKGIEPSSSAWKAGPSYPEPPQRHKGGAEQTARVRAILAPPRDRNRHGSFGEILRCGFSDSALKARRETHVGNRSRSTCLACTAFGYISPDPTPLNGNTFPAGGLPSAAARRCADHASSAARFSSAQSCL